MSQEPGATPAETGTIHGTAEIGAGNVVRDAAGNIRYAAKNAAASAGNVVRDASGNIGYAAKNAVASTGNAVSNTPSGGSGTGAGNAVNDAAGNIGYIAKNAAFSVENAPGGENAGNCAAGSAPGAGNAGNVTGAGNAPGDAAGNTGNGAAGNTPGDNAGNAGNAPGGENAGNGAAGSAPGAGNAAKRGKLPRFLIFAVILAVALAAAYWVFDKVYMNNDTFGVTFYHVGSDKLENNMRAVLVADLHMAEYGAGNKNLFAEIERLKPDFICVVGDVNTFKDPDSLSYIGEVCAGLVKIAPTYYAMGNHEVNTIIISDEDVKRVITDAGVTLLNNRVVTTVVNGNTVSIGGMTQPYTKIDQYAPDFLEEMTGADGYKILLHHYPISFLSGMDSLDVDLAMCGHAHGGQVRLPFVNALYTPDQGLLPSLTEGLHQYEYMDLVVSRGLGNSSVIPRINNPPELVVVDMCTY